MPDILTDIVLREADVEIIVGGSTISMGSVFDVLISPKPVLSSKDYLNRSEVKGYVVNVKFQSNQNSNEWLREITSFSPQVVDVKILDTYTNKLFPFINVFLIVTPDIDFNLNEKLISYEAEKYCTFDDLISLIPPAGDYLLYIEKYNHDFSMISEETTYAITAVSKVSDPTSPTGYFGIITLNAATDFSTGNRVIVSGISDSYWNGLRAVTVVDSTHVKYAISSLANSGPTISSATAQRDAYTLLAQIDSRLIVNALDGTSHYPVEIWIRNYLLPEDRFLSDYVFADHSIFKNTRQHISVPIDIQSGFDFTTAWGIGNLIIEPTLDLASGASWVKFASGSLTATEYSHIFGNAQ